MPEREGPSPEKMGEKPKPGMGRREFLQGLTGLGAAAGLAREARGEPQKSKDEKEDREKEKDAELLDLISQAKKFDDFEEKNINKYIQSKKDSKEERDIHSELFHNNVRLEDQLQRLHELSIIEFGKKEGLSKRNELLQLWLDLRKNIERRRAECNKAGKTYIDSPPEPKIVFPK